MAGWFIPICDGVTRQDTLNGSPPGGGVGRLTVTLAFAVAEFEEFEHLTEYVVVCAGLTSTFPDGVPLVEKSVPVHSVAPVDDQVRRDCSP